MQTTLKHLKHYQKPSQITLPITFKIDNSCQCIFTSKALILTPETKPYVGPGLQNAKLLTLCAVTDLQILQARGEKDL